MTTQERELFIAIADGIRLLLMHDNVSGTLEGARLSQKIARRMTDLDLATEES